MPRVRTRGTALQDKFSSRAAAAAAAYRAGATAPATSWAAPTAAAEGKWNAGVMAAATAHRFSMKVTAAGDVKYKASINAEAQTRFSTGVVAGAANFVAGITPYLDLIEATTLPERTDDVAVNVMNRCSALAVALHAYKLAHP